MVRGGVEDREDSHVQREVWLLCQHVFSLGGLWIVRGGGWWGRGQRKGIWGSHVQRATPSSVCVGSWGLRWIVLADVVASQNKNLHFIAVYHTF